MIDGAQQTVGAQQCVAGARQQVVSMALVRRASASVGDSQWEVMVTEDALSGAWHLHGGKVEANETLPEAVIRETYGETGVCVKDMHELTTITVRAERDVTVFASDDFLGEATIAEPETHSEHRWVPVASMSAMRPAWISLAMSEAAVAEFCRTTARVAAQQGSVGDADDERERREKERWERDYWYGRGLDGSGWVPPRFWERVDTEREERGI